jgi:hypothetical protein
MFFVWIEMCLASYFLRASYFKQGVYGLKGFMKLSLCWGVI